MNIYELKEQYMRLQALAESGEFDQEAIDEAMADVEDAIEQKAENYALVMKNLEGNVMGLDAEIKRLQAMKKSVESNIDYMKDRLSDMLTAAEKKKFKTDHFAFSFRKSESVSVVDQTLLPGDYIKVKVTELVDKTEIKKAIKAGEIIPGAELIQKQNLQIK
jgi:hypothetical protein